MTEEQGDYVTRLELVLARYLFDRPKDERSSQLAAVIESLHKQETVWAVILCGVYEMPEEMVANIMRLFDVRRLA